MAHIVAIQQIGVAAQIVQPLFHQIGDGRFARARKTCEPQHRRFLVQQGGAGLFVNVQCLPLHIGRAVQGKVDHPSGNRCPGCPVDQHERAGLVVFAIGVKGYRRRKADVADPDFVANQGAAGLVAKGVHVDAVFERGDGCLGARRADFHRISAPGQHRLIAKPQQLDGELIGSLRGGVGRGQNIAAAGVDFIGQSQSD